jgi:hypothetical protein
LPAGRPRARLALIAAFVPLLALVGLEGALSLLWPQPPRGFSGPIFEARGGLAYLKPGVRGRHGAREFLVSVDGDARGYRAGTGVAAPDGAAWVFGDSFVFGWGVEAAEAATAVLTRGGLPCANFGMPDDGLPEYAARLSLLAPAERPRAIAVVLYDNDLTWYEARRQGPTLLAERAAAGSVGFELGRWRSRLVQLEIARLSARGIDALGLSDALGAVAGIAGGRRDFIRADLDVHARGFLETPDFQAHSARLSALLESARRRAPRVALVRIAPLYTLGGEATRQQLGALGERPEAFDFGQLDRVLESLAREHGARFARFPGAGRGERPGDFHARDRHLTREGQAGLAEALREALTGT